MRLEQLYSDRKPVISFELFPPQTEEGFSRLERRITKLISLKPSFMTVTYGALGSTRGRTLELASKIKNSYGMEVGHHLTCVGSTSEDIEQLLQDIRREKIDNIVALRGDPPEGQAKFQPPPGGYEHADQLVEYISGFGGFGIAVAGYPEKHIEATDLKTDLMYLKRKVEMGADAVVTQLFYDNRLFYDFVDRCHSLGIDKPIIPGLLPILSLDQIRRITEVCGSTIPEELLDRLIMAGGDRKEVHRIGIEHTVDQARDLLGQGAKGIHFYVLNQYFHIAEIMEQLRSLLGDVLSE